MAAAFVVAFAPAARAQTADPSQNARMRFGPLALTPALSITNAGFDTNVFNEAKDQVPKRDFTITIQPRTDAWLHLGRSILSGSFTQDLVWFKRYSSERSANTTYKAGVLVPLTRLSFNANASYLNTRERPGFEIDARARRAQWAFDGSAEFLALSKTHIGARATRQIVNFDKDQVFLGSNLHDELTRTGTDVAATLRYDLTPLTSVTFDVGKGQDRFRFSPLRDSDSTTASMTVTFDPFALIKGNARFGYRDFKPVDPSLQSFRGSTAAVDLSYVAFGSTKLGMTVSRDVKYSFDINQPYYVETGVTGSIAQQIFGPVDAVARAGYSRLAYRDRAGVAVEVSNRRDFVHTYGFGLGYHLGKELRVGFNADNSNRTSLVNTREYDGWRYGTAVTYAF